MVTKYPEYKHGFVVSVAISRDLVMKIRAIGEVKLCMKPLCVRAKARYP